MFKQRFIFSLLFGVFLSIQGFCQSDDEILITEADNLEWLETFKRVNSKKEKLRHIKSKIKADSILVKHPPSCRIVINNSTTTVRFLPESNCDCKILFLVINGDTSYILDLYKHPEYSSTVSKMKSRSIHRITIIEGIEASAIFGSMGRCGVVLLEPNKKLIRRFRAVSKDTY